MTWNEATSRARAECPACLSSATGSFYSVDDVPAHSVLLMDSREQAVSYPRGRIDLHRCDGCDFVYNAAFDRSLQEYSSRYEETQGFSSTFQEFHRRLAERLITRWDLRGKRVLEIGCGKGEFLALLCELGDNSGVGFDPAYVPDRGPKGTDVQLRFCQENYPPPAGAAILEAPPDFVCCKMTMEHIPNVRAFVSSVRRSLPSTGTVVFFQVPDAERIFRDAAFWDIYYEHCSYFTRRSLVHLFEACGFNVSEAWTEYDGQYLMLSAVTAPSPPPRGPGSSRPSPPPAAHDAHPLLDVQTFAGRVAADVDRWRVRIGAEKEAGGSVCLWGAGSKAVAFLSVVGAAPVSFAVDINPHRAGTYLPGSGLEIVGPRDLAGRQPSLVIAMNPVYRDEIAADLGALGVKAKLEALP